MRTSVSNSRGSKRWSEFAISNKVITGSWYSTYIHNIAWGIWLWHLFLSNHILWLVLGPSIPLKMTTRSWKFAQIHNFWSQILYCYSFKTNHKFWPFLRHPSDQKWSKIAYFSKINQAESKFLQRKYFSTEIWYCHLFRKNHKFWSFLGHPGRQMEGPKKSKIS